MQKANFYKKIEKKKLAKYKWQDDVIQMSKKIGIAPGILFKAWIVGGYRLLNRIASEMQDSNTKNPIKKIGWIIKTWK